MTYSLQKVVDWNLIVIVMPKGGGVWYAFQNIIILKKNEFQNIIYAFTHLAFLESRLVYLMT